MSTAWFSDVLFLEVSCSDSIFIELWVLFFFKFDSLEWRCSLMRGLVDCYIFPVPFSHHGLVHTLHLKRVDGGLPTALWVRLDLVCLPWRGSHFGFVMLFRLHKKVLSVSAIFLADCLRPYTSDTVFRLKVWWWKSLFYIEGVRCQGFF